ncbi:phage baseplate assembly protein V [Methylobacillus methanolivorans]|uniref:Phage baseplate assembly protein V n=1 Tax=Methylobacillus methanolivorans TaxID=1848927 RepID=A0ABW8GHH7_9PROT
MCGHPQLQLLIAGKTLTNLHALSIEQRLNTVPFASVQLAFSALEQLDEEGGTLLPGQPIEIKADEHIVFSGTITTHNINLSLIGCIVTLNCHCLVGLTTLPRSRIFQDMSDRDIAAELLHGHDVQMHFTGPTLHHKCVIQHQLTDWDFLLQRLRAIGLVARCSGQMLDIMAPALTPDAGFLLARQDLISLDLMVDGSQQVAGLRLSAWDPNNQALEVAEAEAVDFPVNERLVASRLATAQPPSISTTPVAGEYDSPELQYLANAELMRSRLAMIQGRITALGLHLAQPGQTLLLQEYGDHVSGQYYISGVKFELTPGAAPQTHFDIGLPAEAKQQVPASAPLSPSLFIGKVLDVNHDPDGASRIKVHCPLIDPAGHGVWARLATLQAGNGSGTTFRPAEGSEVILGLTSANPRDVVILGACHSSAITTPWDEATLHGYRSPNGLTISLDDDKQEIRISTNDGTLLHLSQDANATLQLADQYQNKIQLSKHGMRLESSSIHISTNDFTLEARSDINIKGSNVRMESTAQGEIRSAGHLTLRGAIVSIN